MEIDISDVINTVIAAIIIFLGQRIVSSRDKRLEKMEARLEELEKSDKQNAIAASKIEDIKANVQWIKDKIYDD